MIRGLRKLLNKSKYVDRFAARRVARIPRGFTAIGRRGCASLEAYGGQYTRRGGLHSARFITRSRDLGDGVGAGQASFSCGAYCGPLCLASTHSSRGAASCAGIVCVVLSCCGSFGA